MKTSPNNVVLSTAISFLLQGCCAFATEGTLKVYDKLTQEPIYGATASFHIRHSPSDPWDVPRYEKQMLKEAPLAFFSFLYPNTPFREASIGVTKKGYYAASISLGNFTGEKPENPISLALSPIQSPISLIAFNWWGEDVKFIYKGNKNVKQYDCLKADWLPPDGEGLKADMEFSLQRYNKNGKTYAWFSIRFINPHDGFEEVTEYYADSMRIREAPAMKNLQNQLDFIEELHDGFPTHFPPLKNYAFRVRTQQTPSGELLSAYYGKLYNAFTFNYVKDYWACDFEYYLNPTPNDRNLEYNGRSINKPKERINAIRYVR